MDRPTVLIVDDDATLLDLYAEWLKPDYDVRTAQTGTEAIDMVGPDIEFALLDRDLPGLDGDEVLEHIREQECDCRVAMITASQPDLDIVEMDFDRYLIKPISRDEMHDTLQRLRRISAYDATLQEYYSLIHKQTALECNVDWFDPQTNPVLADLRQRIDELESELDGLRSDFDDIDYLAALRQSIASD